MGVVGSLRAGGEQNLGRRCLIVVALLATTGAALALRGAPVAVGNGGKVEQQEAISLTLDHVNDNENSGTQIGSQQVLSHNTIVQQYGGKDYQKCKSGESSFMTCGKHLYAAVANSMDKEVDWLLQQGVSPNFVDSSGQTPVFYAAAKDDMPMLQNLIHHHADASQLDFEGKTVLFTAARNNAIGCTRYLIFEAGVSPRSEDKDENTSLFEAAAANALEPFITIAIYRNRSAMERVRAQVAVHAQVNTNKNYVNIVNNIARRLVGHQLEERIQVAEDAVKDSVDVGHKNKYGQTCLHVAAEKGNLEIVQLIVEAFGGNPEQQDGQNRSSFWFAARAGRLAVVKYFMETRHIKVKVLNQDSVFMAALHPGNEHVAQYILDAFVKAHSGDVLGKFWGSGQSILLALHSGLNRVAQVIIAKYPAVLLDPIDRTGGTATLMHLLVRNDSWFDGLQEMVFFSNPHEVRGASIQDLLQVQYLNARTSNGATPLANALYYGSSKWISALLKHHADTSVLDYKGNTLYSYLAHAANCSSKMTDQMDIIEELERGGADPKTVASNQQTALFDAAGAGNLQLAQWLIEKGLDVNQIDQLGLTPLMVASYECKTDLAFLLLNSSADAQHTDSNGASALHAAAASPTCCPELVETYLRMHVDFNMQDHGGYTALSYAAKSNCKPSVDALIHAGAKLHSLTAGGRFAGQIAMANWRSDSVQSLNDAFKEG